MLIRHMKKKKKGENRRRGNGMKPKLCLGGFSCSHLLLQGSGYRILMLTLPRYMLCKTFHAAKTTGITMNKATVSMRTSPQEEYQVKMYKILSQFCLQMTTMYTHFLQKIRALMKRA